MSIFTGSGVAVVTPLNADESVNYNKLDYQYIQIFQDKFYPKTIH